MKLGARERWFVLIALLTLTLSAAAWVREGVKSTDTELVESPPRPARTAAVPPARSKQAPERVHLEKMRAPAETDQGKDAFESRSWQKSRPKMKAPLLAAAPLPPPPAQAPPLPFVYMGKIFSEETNVVFLTAGERNLSVHEGDVIDSMYRVEKISSAGLVFTYIPMGIQQTLPVGGRQ